MESPIDPRVWKYAFHTTAVLLTGRMLLSLWNERRVALSILDEPFAQLKSAQTPQDKNVALQDALDAVQMDAAQKKGSAKNAILHHADAVVACLVFNPDNVDTARTAMKVVQKCFATDVEGKRALYNAGGYKKLMSVLSKSHEAGNRVLMEDAALTLKVLTEVDDQEVVLPRDVPAGAEGAHYLCSYPSTAKMLKVLDPSQPILFLNAVTGIFANLCVLYEGATRIGKGTGGKSGASYFLRLLDHGNQGIVEHSIRAIRYISRHNDISHDEICQLENVKKIGALVDVNRDPRIVNAVLTVLLVMCGSGKPECKAAFFTILENQTNALASMFLIWCRGTEKTIRDRAEVLVHIMESTTQCSSTIRKLLEMNRANIMERRAKDEEARKKAAQQAKQQEMFQQMMMQQMMGGGGGSPEDMAAMMGME